MPCVLNEEAGQADRVLVESSSGPTILTFGPWTFAHDDSVMLSVTLSE